jgi:hypothetical protein
MKLKCLICMQELENWHGEPLARNIMTVRREIAQYAFLVKRPSTGSGRPEPVEGRISYLACDDTDTLIPPCASHFTNDERRRTQRRIRDCSRSVRE